MTTSPSADNYYIGKGIVTIQLDGEGSPRDVGNVPEFELTLNIERLDHYSSRTGIRKKDRSVVIEASGTLRIVMEEVTAKNLQVLLLGSISQDTAGNNVIDILSDTSLFGQVFFTGTNSIGQQLDIALNKVEFAPSAALEPISDEWGRIEVTGEVVEDGAGNFGTVTIRDTVSA